MTRQIAAALLVATTAPALLAPATAAAEIYIGFGAGGSRIEADPADLGVLPQGFDPPAIGQTPGSIAADQARVTDFGATDLGVQFAIGWRSRFVGVEVGYVNFNQFGRSQAKQFYELPETSALPPNPDGSPAPCDPANPPVGSGGCQEREWAIGWSGDGYQASVLGYLPLGESVELYGKVGAIYWEAEATGEERVRTQVPPINQIPAGNDKVATSDDGTDLTVGIGAIFKTGTPFSVRVQADYFDLDNTDLVMLYTVNAVYSFGQSD
jgi:hypothetical protein